MTVQPASINFRMYPHATLEEVVTLRDALGDPIDLTGRTAKCQIRREMDDADVVFDLDTTNTEIVLGGVLGTVTFNLTATQTGTPVVDIDGETWVYDLLIIDGATVERAYQGYVFVIPGVTRP